MQCDYIAIDGKCKEFDLDKVIDFVGGFSKKRDGWSGLICYMPNQGIFLELRDSPQDARGNSHSEAEEVTSLYIESAYQLSSAQVTSFLNKPDKWQFIDHR